MKRAVLIALVLGAAAGVTATSDAIGGSPAKPALQLARGAPLTVRGIHFRSGERVTVSVLSGRKTMKRTTAGSGGTFLVRFATTYDRCEGLLVVARGAYGSRATLKRPLLACPPRL
jgi:hypothetical protein